MAGLELIDCGGGRRLELLGGVLADRGPDGNGPRASQRPTGRRPTCRAGVCNALFIAALLDRR